MSAVRIDRKDKKWRIGEAAFLTWIALGLIVLIPATLYLQGSFPFFTVLWLVVSLILVIRNADASQAGFRKIPWRGFLATTGINLAVLILISAVIEPWSHAYQALVSSALSNTPPDPTFAWLVRFSGFKAWAGLILFSGLVTLFGEELFFRGWLLQVLRRKLNKNLAIVLQATLFTLPQLLAVILMSPLQGVVYAVFYIWLAAGIVGGWAAARTQSIWPSLTSATIWNASLIAIVLCMGNIGHASIPAANRFHITEGRLLDANGNNFMMRGISEPYAWFPNRTSAFANIKAAGANTVRVVLSGVRWKTGSASVARVVQLCKKNRLVCVLEDHDTTGYGEDGEAYPLSQAVSFWKQVKDVLIGQEAYVIIDIGNEPYGNIGASAWVNDMDNAILAMRNAGFHHTLMIDAPNWGQDRQFLMRDHAAAIFENDPERNIIFSIHMYEFFDSSSVVQQYITSYTNAGLPLVIGEFGWKTTYGDPDEVAIMAEAQKYGIGYIAWSWSGNSGGADSLDMVAGFDPDRRTPWGTLVIEGENGLQQTSSEATIYTTGH